MKILRFSHRNNARWGFIDNGYVRLLKGDIVKAIVPALGKVFLNKIKFLPPFFGTKVILVGLNYKDHAKELKMKLPPTPVIFLKPLTTLIGHKEAVVYPRTVKQLDYEAELAVIIGKEGKNIKAQLAHRYIFGYTCLNDITARDLQRKDIQWTRAKSFDGFCPLGPWIETELNPSDLHIRSYLNGQLMQNSSTKNLIFSIPYLISFVSKVMRLFPGDIISTGTPFGVGPMQRGDTIEVEIENIARLKNYIN